MSDAADNAPIDIVIREIEERVRGLRSELAQAEEALRSARRTRDLLTGRKQARASPEPKAPSLVDAAEQVLRTHGEMSLKDLVEKLREAGYHNASKQTLSSALSRLHAMRRRFIRVGPNVYRVRTEEDKD